MRWSVAGFVRVRSLSTFQADAIFILEKSMLSLAPRVPSDCLRGPFAADDNVAWPSARAA